MAQVVVERPVVFSGIWRPRGSVDDAFLRMVSQQFLAKSGAQATWRLSTEGLTLVAQRTEGGSGGGGRQAQTDPISVQAIREVTVNRYNPLCLMTLYVDPTRRFNALVCRCQTEQDAAHIVQVFRQLQKSLSGEGYRIDLKQPQGINWTLKTRRTGHKEDGEEFAGDLNTEEDRDHLSKNGNGEGSLPDAQHHLNNNDDKVEMVVEMVEEKLEREPLEVEGRHCFNVGVQADLAPDDDNVSLISEMSYQSLKEELETLSNEVRDIKILLEQTTGISAEEFFRRRRDPQAAHLVPVKRHLSEESETGKTGNGEKSVNFAAMSGAGEEEMDFDIRSVGMQTDTGSKRGKYQKRVRNVLTPSRYQQRNRSDGSSLTSSGATSPASPFSPNRTPDGSVFFSSSLDQDYMQSRRDRRYVSPSSLSKAAAYTGGGGTVVRPIESVYQAHTPGFRQKRRQVIVLPTRSASMPRQFRPSSASHARSPAGPDQAPRSPAGPTPQNGAS